jgi:hypothetical protein
VHFVFFALLFLNLVYFAWAHWIDAPRPPPVNEAIAHLPQLMARELPPAGRPPGHGTQKTALNDTTGCRSVGPFVDPASSAQAAALLKAKGFDPRQRAEQGQVAVGYWVYVGRLASQAEADRALVTLERNVIKDALVMPETDDTGRHFLTGVLQRALPRRAPRSGAPTGGTQPQIAESKLPDTLYWVDLTPPPGMNTVPLQGLFADGVSSRIAVQPCLPATAAPPTTAATGPAATPTGGPPSLP